MIRAAVIDDYDGSIAALPCWKRLESLISVDFSGAPVDPGALADYEVLVTVRERTILTREFLEPLAKLRHVALTGRLSGQVDPEILKERGITVNAVAPGAI